MALADVRNTLGSCRNLLYSTLAVATMITAVQLLGLTTANAQYGVKDYTIQQQYISQRALGMGNAFTALADDYSALFYNPAGLARLTEGQINMGLAAGVDSKTQSFVKDIGDTSGSGQVSDMINLLEKNLGSHYSARLPLFNAFWVRPKWGLAILPIDLSLDMEIHQLATYSLNVIATQDTTIAYGRGWDVNWFDSGRMSLGVTGKAIYRGYFNRSIPASDLIFEKEVSKFLKAEDAGEGFTFDVDFGMLYTPAVGENAWAKPTFGFVVHNVADYGFKSNFHLLDKNSKEAPRLQRRFDLGTALELPDWWIWKTRFMADIKDIGHENWTFSKGSHVGTEFLWKIRSWWQGGWRVGLSQGYFTAGVTAKFGIFNLDVVTYANETGVSDSNKASRIYMAKTSLDF